MQRLSHLKNTITSVIPCVGGGSGQKRSSNRPHADPEVAQWLARKLPSEDRAGALKVIEAAEKYRHRRVPLSRHGLAELPAKVTSLIATEELDLSKNQLAQWPEQIRGLCNLKDLNISVNSLNGIPAAVALHTRLESLNASSNGISAIAPKVAELRYLRTLDLTDNRLTAVPEEILGLPELRELSLAQNKIGKLTAMDRLYKLKELDLSCNPLGAIPDGPDDPEDALRTRKPPAAKLPAGLEKLHLADTMLEDIPASLALPEHVGKLKSLKYLDVSSNPLLHKLPLDFGAFKTSGPDKVVSLKLPDRKVELTVLHEGTGVVQGLEQDGRLKGRPDSNPGGRAATPTAGPYEGETDAMARRYVQRQRGLQRSANSPQPQAGGYVPPVQANAGMYGNVGAMPGVQPAVAAHYAAPYAFPPFMPNPGATFAQAPAQQASTSAAAPQVQPTAAEPSVAPPGVAQPGLGMGQQFDATNPQAWLMQLGVNQLVQMYQAQLQAAMGLGLPPAAFPMQPSAFPLQQAAFPMQQAAFSTQQAPFSLQPASAPAAFLAAQVAAAQRIPPNTIYDGRHDAELRDRNFGIRRDQQMREVCQTIPTVLTELGINELVMSIKQQVYSMGLSEHQTRDMIGNKLVELGAGLYRQRMVDEIARQETLDRADPNVDAHTRSIAYQAYLAETLGLPGPIMGLVDKLNVGQMRRDLFDGVFSQEALAREGARVGNQVEMAETSDRLNGYKQFKTFLNGQKFWQEHSAQDSAYLRNALYANLR